jgi:hypothetical protein
LPDVIVELGTSRVFATVPLGYGHEAVPEAEGFPAAAPDVGQAANEAAAVPATL